MRVVTLLVLSALLGCQSESGEVESVSRVSQPCDRTHALLVKIDHPARSDSARVVPLCANKPAALSLVDDVYLMPAIGPDEENGGYKLIEEARATGLWMDAKLQAVNNEAPDEFMLQLRLRTLDDRITIALSGAESASSDLFLNGQPGRVEARLWEKKACLADTECPDLVRKSTSS